VARMMGYSAREQTCAGSALLPRNRSSAAFRTRALATVSCSIMRWRDVGRNASAIGADQGNDQEAGPARLTSSRKGEDNGRSHRSG